MSELSNPVGRPTVMTEDVLGKLEYAFSHGLTDNQACLYANISPATLYKFQLENPEYVERKNALKDNVTMRAKLNVAKKIEEGNIGESQWWLERKAKDEFSTRSEHINANVDVNKLSDEEKEKINGIINANTQPGGN